METADQPRARCASPDAPGCPRVLHILGELRPSGAEVMLRCAAPHWFSEPGGHVILSTGDTVGPFGQSLEAAGYEVLHEAFKKSIRFFARVFGVIHRGKFDAVHIHSERAGVFYALVARLAGVQNIVHTVHAVFPFTGALRVARKLMRRGIRAFGVVQVSISRSVRDNEICRFGNPTQTIPNWYDETRFRPPTDGERRQARAELGISDNQLVFATVGNCAPVKNHNAVLGALEIVLRTRPDWLYLHAGGEDAERSERAAVDAVGLARHCAFLGYVLDPIKVLWAADMFVMSSLQEGFGVAAVEAAGCGLPLVLSDAPGLRDLRGLVPDAVWVTPDGDGIARGLQEACERFPLRSTRNHREVQERFATAIGASSYFKLYCGTGSPRNRAFHRHPQTNTFGSEFRDTVQERG